MPSGQAPKIDSSTGKLSGEAKFLSFGDGSNSSWNGLVDLSDISYNPSTGNFGGQTPTTPVNVLGQMSWCGSSYCVTTANVTGGNQWPTGVTTTAVSANSFTVQWYNPQSYAGGAQVLYATSSNPVRGWFIIPKLDATSSNTTYSQTINNLSPNTTYYVKIRAFLK